MWRAAALITASVWRRVAQLSNQSCHHRLESASDQRTVLPQWYFRSADNLRFKFHSARLSFLCGMLFQVPCGCLRVLLDLQRLYVIILWPSASESRLINYYYHYIIIIPISCSANNVCSYFRSLSAALSSATDCWTQHKPTVTNRI